MGVQQAVNIAIFGMSLRVLNELKERVLSAVPNHIQVNWSNIAEPQLDILMINHIFVDSPNIQNLIKNSNIKVLRLINNIEKSSSIENDILYLPINHIHSLHHWLNEKLTDTQILKDHKQTSSIEIIKPVQHKHIKEVLDEIQNPKNGKIQIFNNDGLLAIADPRNEWLWQSPDYQPKPTGLSLNYTYATQNNLSWITDSQQQDLKQWLWNLIWSSPDFIELCPASISSFYLEIWPQPKNKIDRQNILRMSACFAKGAQITTVATQLNLSEQYVKLFIGACLATEYGKVIKDSQTTYQPKKQHNETEQHFMKKLFGRLRHRLGF